MAKIWADRLINGTVTWAQVPASRKNAVRQILEDRVASGEITQEQMDAKLRFYAKVRTARGMEYKALPTRKVPGKGQLALQASLNISMFDTIYIGKRLQEKELGKYFYEVDSPVEAASFKAAGKYYVASRPDKNGEPQMKKPLRALFRMVPIQQDEEGLPSKTVIPKGEEIIE